MHNLCSFRPFMSSMRMFLTAATRVCPSNRLFQMQTRDFSKMNGVVKWFNTQKGFGFIEPDDKSGDCFVHQSQIKSSGFRSLAEGESVEFEIVINEEKDGKRYAENVTGPNGADVVGAPRQSSPPRRDGGGGGGFRSGGGGGNRRSSSF